MADISVQKGLEPAYDGTVEAMVFEIDEADPDTILPSNLIRTTQMWGVDVSWEMHGVLAAWLNAEFEISIYVESKGSGPEVNLPATPVRIATLSVPLKPGFKREYTKRILFYPTTPPTPTQLTPNGVAFNYQIPAGVYEMAMSIQLYDDGTNEPVPVAGLVDLPTVKFFKPHG